MVMLLLMATPVAPSAGLKVTVGAEVSVPVFVVACISLMPNSRLSVWLLMVKLRDSP
ncbi:uncharacterized protein METZ01_LOCUS292536 [marine metagenome]|uniref:Uncharacterized protein n=1 Tax=marine metagenome TaxID=408172 RepID=A0A382LX96_9ZZZZ